MMEPHRPCRRGLNWEDAEGGSAIIVRADDSFAPRSRRLSRVVAAEDQWSGTIWTLASK
jgi:hypothetical protein